MSASAAPDDTAGRPNWRPRRILLIAGGLTLLAGLYGGLLRLGLLLPGAGSSLVLLHGPLVIAGGFGALIGLERAAALGRNWAYAGPLASILGTIALLAGAPVEAGGTAFALGAAVLVAASLLTTIRQPAIFTGTLLLGAACLLAGNVLWALGAPVPEVVGWWLGFLVLTIAGERLELSRLAPARRGSEALFLSALGLLVVGARNGIVGHDGATLFGAALLLMALWLLRHDIAVRSIRQHGQTRFFAACMLTGYAWLGIAGGLLIAGPPTRLAFGYDVALHAILIGFVVSMVFGHALIILPALAGVRLPYAPALYGPLALLHASVALRLAGGLLDWQAGRVASGGLTLLAVGAFAGILLLGRLRTRRSAAQPLTGDAAARV